MYPQEPVSSNPLSPDVEKNSYAFGLKAMRQAYARWKNGYGGESYNDRQLRYEKNRLYSMGKQPSEQYKDLVKIEGTPVVVNLDYSPLAIATPLLNAKTDRYMQRDEEIKCKGSGPGAANRRKKEKDNAKFKLNYGDAIKQLQQESGMQLEEFSDNDPKSERALDVRLKTQPIREEVIMQLAIRKVFEQNDWHEMVKPRLIWDLGRSPFLCIFVTTYQNILYLFLYVPTRACIIQSVIA